MHSSEEWRQAMMQVAERERGKKKKKRSRRASWHRCTFELWSSSHFEHNDASSFRSIHLQPPPPWHLIPILTSKKRHHQITRGREMNISNLIRSLFVNKGKDSFPRPQRDGRQSHLSIARLSFPALARKKIPKPQLEIMKSENWGYQLFFVESSLLFHALCLFPRGAWCIIWLFFCTKWTDYMPRTSVKRNTLL